MFAETLRSSLGPLSHFDGLDVIVRHVKHAASSSPIAPVWIGLLVLAGVFIKAREQIILLVKFAYACFIAPIGHADEQKTRLDSFYRSQAGIYDATRTRLLKGREEMLRLLAGHLEQQQKDFSQDRKLIWVDIGSGTGYNIEVMDPFFPIERFEAIYLIDLCEYVH